MIAGGMVLAASGNEVEETIWVQLLVLVMLAAGVGVYTFVRKRTKQFEEQKDYPDYRRWSLSLQGLEKKIMNAKRTGIYSETIEREEDIEKGPVFESGAVVIAGDSRLTDEAAREKDLGGGMEMLEQDLLVRIVEQIEGQDECDVIMRKLSFGELVRRGQLGAAESKALKVYATNSGNLYSKDIQCQAMRELAERTGVLV